VNEEGTRVGLSPAVARRRLGTELRRLREKAGRKVEDAAKALDCSTAKISRLENGKGVPYPRDVRDLAVLYDAEAELDHLIELAEDGRAQDWFSNFKDVLQGELMADHLQRYAQLERDASSIKSFEPELIPGLLQSEEYVDVVYRHVFPHVSDYERARFVQFRRQRQDAVLRRPTPPDLAFAVSELAILRLPGGADVLRRQLEGLLADLRGPLSEVEFRLLPLMVDTPAALGGPFAILRYASEADQDSVYLEGRDGAHWLESNDDVRRYEDKFDSLLRHSLSRAESLRRLEQQIKELG
jgi:transcriptional regulator with XRE-family HTH domain